LDARGENNPRGGLTLYTRKKSLHLIRERTIRTELKYYSRAREIMKEDLRRPLAIQILKEEELRDRSEMPSEKGNDFFVAPRDHERAALT